MSTPTTPLARELVSMACLAPSVHNTQPWSWHIVNPTVIELSAERTRQLLAADPLGRDLAISCGAALQHLSIAARAFGLEAATTLMPEPEDHDLLARVDLRPGHAEPRDVELLAALENRTTDRRGFTGWEVPVSRLEHLADAGVAAGIHVDVLTDPAAVARTEALLEQSRTAQLADPGIVAEQDEWVGRPGAEGVPARLAHPSARPGATPPTDRFSGPQVAVTTRDPEHPALMVISTIRDDQESWLRAGQSLSAIWIRATLDGLSVSPQSHVVEVDETRHLLRDDVFESLMWPQVVVRIGWQETSRPSLDRTPRRALADVLRP